MALTDWYHEGRSYLDTDKNLALTESDVLEYTDSTTLLGAPITTCGTNLKPNVKHKCAPSIEAFERCFIYAYAIVVNQANIR
jgi:hypothetical protein